MRSLITFHWLILLSLNALAEPPLGLPDLIHPKNNVSTPAKIKLGQRLFFDNRLSGDGTISCSNCHQPSLAFTDGQKVAVGIYGQLGTRNSPTLINSAYYQKLFHDGRRDSLEQQALDPFVHPLEHGLIDLQQLNIIIKQDAEYRKQFAQAFASQANPINSENIAKTIASYLRTLISGNSAFDRYLFGRDKSALSISAARGYKIFRRKGNCANCHEISWDHALFTDNRFYNIGIGMERLKPQIDDMMLAIAKNRKINRELLTNRQISELGRYQVTKTITDIGKFKTPTLRNIARTAPYMQDGSLQTLAEVVEYYDQGGYKNKFLDAAIFPLNLNDQEKSDLVAFLNSLDSPNDSDKPILLSK